MHSLSSPNFGNQWSSPYRVMRGCKLSNRHGDYQLLRLLDPFGVRLCLIYRHAECHSQLVLAKHRQVATLWSDIQLHRRWAVNAWQQDGPYDLFFPRLPARFQCEFRPRYRVSYLRRQACIHPRARVIIDIVQCTCNRRQALHWPCSRFRCGAQEPWRTGLCLAFNSACLFLA